LGTTLGARGITVLIQEPPDPPHPIGFLRCLQLAAFVRPNVPRKLFVWPVKWDTFACSRRLCFLSHGPRPSTARPRSTPPPFLSSAFLTRRCGLQLLEQLRHFLSTDIEQHPALAFNLDGV
jgi:hypothetical protein